MSDDARFDPRFDPAFQPGYVGPTVVPDIPTRAPGAPGNTGAPGTTVVSETRVVSGNTVMSGGAEPPRALEPDARVSQSSPPTVDLMADADAPLDEGRRANPFLITLGALSLLMIFGGVYVVSRMRDLFSISQSSSDFDFVTQQVLMYAVPLVIVLGIATGIGVLFVFAVRWGRP